MVCEGFSFAHRLNFLSAYLNADRGDKGFLFLRAYWESTNVKHQAGSLWVDHGDS
jgi:hypothetical protein